MADKKRVKKNIKQLQRIKTWQLVIVLLLTILIAATFLRLNNIGMLERRDAVYAADKAGDSEILKNRLYDLQRYVSAHMNANPDKIALEGQYERDSQRAKALAEAAGSNNPNGNVYQKAADVCDPIGRAQGWRWPDPRYIACVDAELSKYPATTGSAQTIQLPDVNLYYHSFVSPLWSPDFAGWSVIICAVIVVMIIARIVGLLVLRAMLRQHFRSI
ncbi:MAG: hypothetical protein JWM00_212 [Candidatus Saccharibacteria bacterium]|nr:hypothetical protein [Candidatus Saccharibacteria bacterium]